MIVQNRRQRRGRIVTVKNVGLPGRANTFVIENQIDGRWRGGVAAAEEEVAAELPLVEGRGGWDQRLFHGFIACIACRNEAHADLAFGDAANLLRIQVRKSCARLPKRSQHISFIGWN